MRTYAQLASAVTLVIGNNKGLDFPMWCTVANRDSCVYAVARTGEPRPGSQVISAQKATTANAFRNSDLALSTAN